MELNPKSLDQVKSRWGFAYTISNAISPEDAIRKLIYRLFRLTSVTIIKVSPVKYKVKLGNEVLGYALVSYMKKPSRWPNIHTDEEITYIITLTKN